LANADELVAYVQHLRRGVSRIPKGTFQFHRDEIIEAPTTTPDRVMFERFVPTAKIRVDGMQLDWSDDVPWVEATIAFLERDGQIHPLPPTIAVRRGGVLSMGERFQSGTGVTLTPPPAKCVRPEAVAPPPAAIA